MFAQTEATLTRGQKQVRQSGHHFASVTTGFGGEDTPGMSQQIIGKSSHPSSEVSSEHGIGFWQTQLVRSKRNSEYRLGQFRFVLRHIGDHIQFSIVSDKLSRDETTGSGLSEFHKRETLPGQGMRSMALPQ